MHIKCLFCAKNVDSSRGVLFCFVFLREDSYFNLFFYCPVDHDRCVLGGWEKQKICLMKERLIAADKIKHSSELCNFHLKNQRRIIIL